jgi:REP element-mobilizing transposase RayT
MRDLLAYHLTWTTYGSWLPGDRRGWVDSKEPGIQRPNEHRERFASERVKSPTIRFDEDQREIVDGAIRSHCDIRRWTLHALNVRTNHVHLVVSAAIDPDNAILQFKAWCSRRLNERHHVSQRWWTRGGSTKYIFDQRYLEAAIRYVLDAQ